MRRPTRCMWATLLSLGLGLGAAGVISPLAGEQPNILWITAEDMSLNLGCYGDPHARTPALDAFAGDSVRFTRAFATAPVCSPARSCLITGVYATSLGTQRLRSLFPIPQEFRGFPSYLRDAGYFCSNNVKTDYNTRNEPELIRACWDECSPQAHWRNRRPGQPFFSVFNLMHTHQSRTCVWSFEEFEDKIGGTLAQEQRQDPDRVPLPPFYPDTPLVRRTMARYYDCVTAMDGEVKRLLQEVQDQGLSEDTIVFFYSDHGMGMPRGKRTLYDSGLHVPLIVRFPAKYQHLAPAEPGTVSERLVSFVDFPPTVLSLAGLTPPDYMQGQVFLGPRQSPARQYVFGARDRVDEAYDLSRSVRDNRFLYIRNYLPYVSLNQPEFYSDQAPMRREISRLAAADALKADAWTYARPTKPAEELFDTWNDPHQLHNLATDERYVVELERMREAQSDWTRGTLDLGYLPESEAWTRSGSDTPWALARRPGAYPLDSIVTAANRVGRDEAIETHVQDLKHSDAAVRYWAVVALQAAGSKASTAREPLLRSLRDPAPSVRITAAAALAGLGETTPALRLLARELKSTRPEVVLRSARSLELLGEAASPVRPLMAEVFKQAQENEGTDPLWMFIRFSLESALQPNDAN